jgi:hypothetical protein
MDNFQTKVNNQLRSGDPLRDFHRGIINIQGAIKNAVLGSDRTLKPNVTWAVPHPMPPFPDQVSFTASVNGRTRTLWATRAQVEDSYDRLDDPVLFQEIQKLAMELCER